MKNYVYIFHNEEKMEVSPEVSAAFTKWYDMLGAHIVDSGNPFNPAEQAQIRGDKVTMDADAVSGYTIVKANDLKEAVTWAMECPIAKAPGGSINVYETMPM